MGQSTEEPGEETLSQGTCHSPQLQGLQHGVDLKISGRSADPQPGPITDPSADGPHGGNTESKKLSETKIRCDN